MYKFNIVLTLFKNMNLSSYGGKLIQNILFLEWNAMEAYSEIYHLLMEYLKVVHWKWNSTCVCHIEMYIAWSS